MDGEDREELSINESASFAATLFSPQHPSAWVNPKVNRLYSYKKIFNHEAHFQKNIQLCDILNVLEFLFLRISR